MPDAKPLSDSIPMSANIIPLYHVAQPTHVRCCDECECIDCGEDIVFAFAIGLPEDDNGSNDGWYHIESVSPYDPGPALPYIVLPS